MKKIYLTLTLLACIISARSFSQCSTPTTVPYYEDFSVTANNQIPTCWAISSISTCVTYTAANGNGTAGFLDTPLGSNYFYSPAIQLYAGVTYSASAWFRTFGSSMNTWSDFSIMLGTSQSTTGLVSLASTNGPASNPVYVPITNTFVVATSGVYYFAIRGISMTNGSGSPSLVWDEFEVTIPCAAGNNSPSLTVVASATSLCDGQTVTVTASGANTYSWNTGPTSSSLVITPNQNSQLIVTGTNTLSGCSSTSSPINIIVKPTPNVVVIGTKPLVCLGSSIGLTALGAPSFSWSTGAISNTISVSPSVTAIYTVTGINTNGCSESVNYTVTVHPLPVVVYSTSVINHLICKGEAATFTAGGTSATNYIWSNGQGNGSGDIFSFNAAVSTTVTLTGTAPDGCENKASYILTVDNCSGLSKHSSLASIKIYPNPGKGLYILESGNTDWRSIEIMNLSGRIIFASKNTGEKLIIDLREFSAGIYYAKISAEGKTETIKLIKE